MSKKKKKEKHNKYYYDVGRNYPFNYDLEMNCPPGLEYNKPYSFRRSIKQMEKCRICRTFRCCS